MKKMAVLFTLLLAFNSWGQCRPEVSFELSNKELKVGEELISTIKIKNPCENPLHSQLFIYVEIDQKIKTTLVDQPYYVSLAPLEEIEDVFVYPIKQDMDQKYGTLYVILIDKYFGSEFFNNKSTFAVGEKLKGDICASYAESGSSVIFQIRAESSSQVKCFYKSKNSTGGYSSFSKEATYSSKTNRWSCNKWRVGHTNYVIKLDVDGKEYLTSEEEALKKICQ